MAGMSDEHPASCSGLNPSAESPSPFCRTSVKYHRGNFAELLATFRPELERISNGLDSIESPVKSAGGSQSRSGRGRPRRARAKTIYQEESVSDEQEIDGSDGIEEVGNAGLQREWQTASGAQPYPLYDDELKM